MCMLHCNTKVAVTRLLAERENKLLLFFGQNKFAVMIFDNGIIFMHFFFVL